jgi:hypothetical protein
MKWLILFSFFFSLQSMAAAPESFDMLLTGKTSAGPNANEDLAIRRMIAGFVENLKVKKYLLRLTPANGGFHVCVDPAGAEGYNYILGELNSIAVRESVWDIKLVRSCR